LKGAFVTLEGTEGVGKSTNVPAMQQRLAEAGFDVLITREPGGTALGETIRQWLLDRNNGPLSAEVEILLMFAARAHHLQQVIRPALACGQWVICDRFTDATIAYQGGGRGGERSLIEQLSRAVHGDLEPDLTLLFDAPIDVGMARIEHREADRFELEDREFFERVRQTYLELARAHPQRIKIIDAARPADEVADAVTQTLVAFLRSRR